MSKPVLPGAALALPQEAVTLPAAEATGAADDLLPDDAVAQAPELEREDAVAQAPAVVADDALPVVVPASPREQLVKAGIRSALIDLVAQSVQEFNDTVGDGRVIDELTLGLLWKSEGGATLTVLLDPHSGLFQKRHTDLVLQLAFFSNSGVPAEIRRVWRMTQVGLFGFGLDDIFKEPTGNQEDFVFHTARARWADRLNEHGDWTQSVPFERVRPVSNPATVSAIEPVKISIGASDAIGFLLAVSARFTRQLWLLEEELAPRGIRIQATATEEIPLVEPILAYLCYLHRAPKAAAIWQALVFLREFCNDVYVARPTSSGHYELSVVIGTLNRWLEVLRDPAALALPTILVDLVKDSTATHPNGRLGRHILTEVAERGDWMPTIPTATELDGDGRALLEELVDAWAVYAVELVEGLRNPVPGELLFNGTQQFDADGNAIVIPGHPPLFPGQLGTTGFGARNYGKRFQKATGQPLGQAVHHSHFPEIEAIDL